MHVFDPLTLDDAARDKLASELNTLLLPYFPESTTEAIHRQYFHSGIERSRIALLKEHDRLTGFQIVTSSPVTLPAGDFMIIRSVVARAQANRTRGSRAFERFGPTELIRQALRAHASGRRPWLLGQSAGPVTYMRLAPYFRTILPPPDPHANASPAQRAIFVDLLRTIDMIPEHPEAWSMRNGPIYPISPDERATWLGRPEPTVHRFFQECPDAGTGQVLLFGVELTLPTLAAILPRQLQHLMRRRKRATT
ncbi:hypothetical protein EA187_02845 [Lujinxingia sediminis]|uniref:GNAT family N-acetyltransferase n=1 Tax=Lujinxingia sediminis TaxID=2480984 RepID=A0ABY0CY89_9DELT|nr:hypothetical protein [Lujinxingia sediminis]RVU48390.1 hypothetical protein EA187_02845 [Lujinxingia sediminis]